MQKLERVLASGVLRVLRERAHVVLAPTRSDAICDELELIIAPTVHALTDGGGSELLTEVAHLIAERLAQSDHVDDIFATDNVIRRDTQRVLGQLLRGYERGELDVERADAERSIVVALLDHGYVVAEVAKRLDVGMLRDALERAAAMAGGRLAKLTRQRVATFELPGRPGTSRLALEEAVTQELVSLIEAELVELPSVEQVLELTDVDCLSEEFELTMERSLMRTRSEFDCEVQCVCVDEGTVIATLTPLSAHAAEHADVAFATFLESLEEELNNPSPRASIPEVISEEVPSSRPDSSRRDQPVSSRRDRPDSSRRDQPVSSRRDRPDSSRRKRKPEDTPPRSQPRGRRGAPRAATSSTRQMREGKKRKRAK